MLRIANPIYDVVFKYLMEDPLSASTMLTAIMGTEVKDVIQLKNDVIRWSGSAKNLHLMRLDFTAMVRQEDGSFRKVCIELQKAYEPTEIERFRRYIATQYNMALPLDDKGAPPPLVAIYLLGHTIRDCKEPIIRVNRHYYNQHDEELEEPFTCAFVESLSHDLILVQLPRLQTLRDTFSEKILSVFDQSFKTNAPTFEHTLDYSEDEMVNEIPALSQIVHRLQSAAIESDMREGVFEEMALENILAEQERVKKMLEEDQKLIQETQAKLSKNKAQLSEMGAQITEMDAQITEMDAQITEMGTQITEMDAQITEKDAQITEKDAQITEKDAQLTEKDAQLTEKDAQLTEKDAQMATMIRVVMQMQPDQTMDSVAKTLNIDVKEVERLLNMNL